MTIKMREDEEMHRYMLEPHPVESIRGARRLMAVYLTCQLYALLKAGIQHVILMQKTCNRDIFDRQILR